MSYIVTGGAGFIGSHLVDRLVQHGHVTVLDDLSKGKYLNEKSRFIKIDLRNQEKLNGIRFDSGSEIFHLAANPDVKASMIDVNEHFSRDVATTMAVLEMARKIDAKRIVFSSTSAVYGDAKKLPTPESYKPEPISSYGLFKYLCEQMIEFHSKTYGIDAVVLRLANIVGGRSDHGVITDFINKLKANESELKILGDGKQKKSYLHVSDTVDAMKYINDNSKSHFAVINVGNTDHVTVDEIAKIIEKEMGIKPKHVYADNFKGRGWRGDTKLMLLDIKKLKEMGWQPKHNSKETVKMAVQDAVSGK